MEFYWLTGNCCVHFTHPLYSCQNRTCIHLIKHETWGTTMHCRLLYRTAWILSPEVWGKRCHELHWGGSRDRRENFWITRVNLQQILESEKLPFAAILMIFESSKLITSGKNDWGKATTPFPAVSVILTANSIYPSVCMTEGRIICLTLLSPLTGGRWQTEVGTPISTLETSLGGPTAPHVMCWRNNIITGADPPHQWAGSFLLTPLLMVSLRLCNGHLLLR